MTPEQRRIAARMATSPAELGPLLDGGFVAFDHVRELGRTLADAAVRPGSRQIVNMPPRHGKTLTLAMLIVWFLANNPRARVIFVSYSATLATETSRRVRNYIEANRDILSIRLAPDSAAADRWELTSGGGLLAAGVESRVVGWGGDLIIVDDPHADMAAARNPRAAEAVYRYYRDTLLTRLQAGGRVVLVGHRMAPGDLYGRVLEDEPDRWRVLSLPAVAEVKRLLLPARQTALCPDLFPLDELLTKASEVGPLVWSGMYQQEPRATDGELFPADVGGWATTTTAEVPDRPKHRVRAWDFGATAGGDWTVGTRMCADDTGSFFIEDIVRFRGAPNEVEKRVRATAEADPPGTIVRLPKDPGAAGVAVAQRYEREVLRGYTVIAQPVTGDKVTRALPLSAAVANGSAQLVARQQGVPAPWWESLVAEAATFPGGRHDDVIDATADAFSYLQSKARKGAGGYHRANPKAMGADLGSGAVLRRHSTARPSMSTEAPPDTELQTLTLDLLRGATRPWSAWGIAQALGATPEDTGWWADLHPVLTALEQQGAVKKVNQTDGGVAWQRNGAA